MDTMDKVDDKAVDAPNSEIKRKPVADLENNKDVTAPPPDLESTPAAIDSQPQSTTQPEQPPATSKTIGAPPPAATSNEKASRRISRRPVPSSIYVDKSRPEDFEGEVQTNNEIPSAQTLKEIEDYIVLDSDGRSHAFKTLYSGSNVARRVLVIFIRHFLCGMCQDYISELSASISPESLLRLPLSTSIAIVGCGDPAFIQQYITDTNCKFQIYTDPKRSLFTALGMNSTLNLGSHPDYVKRSMWNSTIGGIVQGLKAIPRGLALKGGNQRQVGGEFLFEPRDLVTPVTTPHEEKRKSLAMPETQEASSGKVSTVEECCHPVEKKTITWCHRMKTTRDHCEMPELMDVLGLNAEGLPGNGQEKQHTTLVRKGTGKSMARQMSELSALNEAAPRDEAPQKAAV